jgi:hypothetical protein
MLVLTLLFIGLVSTVGYFGMQQVARAGSESLQVRGDRTHRGLQQRSIAPRNAEPVEKTAAIGRACGQADAFDYYFLGESFEGLKMAPTGRRCAPPPPKVRAADGTIVFMRPVRENVVAFIYGTCKPPPGPDGGCPAPLSISSSPACEQPHSLYRRYSGGGPPLPHRETRLRGVPAAIFDGAAQGGFFRIEMYTGDARVVLEGIDAEMVRRAVDKMVAPSTSPGGASRLGTDLPKPLPGAAEDDATKNPKC